MTNLKYTPLPISQQLASLGIEVESEKWWEYQEKRGFLFLTSIVSQSATYPAKFYPAYTLADLPAVLKVVGEKRRWLRYIRKDGCSSSNPDLEAGEWTETWQYHFLEICRLFATDPNVAWKYLGEIIN